jgi:hypothetical protein
MTEINQELENKLWSVSDEKPLDKETCDKIIDYLLARLSDYLQTPLELADNENWLDYNCFSTNFREKNILRWKPFDITFGGTLGMQLVGDESYPHTSINIYVFGNGQRLSTGLNSYIYMEYAKQNTNFGSWTSHGWTTDEFEEFEDVAESWFYDK